MKSDVNKTQDSFGIVMGGLFILAVGAGALWYFTRTTPVAPAPTAPIEAIVLDAGAAPVEPDDEESADPDVVRKKDPDGALRASASKLTKSKTLREWFGAPGILQRATAAVWRIADGKSPAPVLRFIEIEGRFEVDEPKGTDDIFMSEKSYRRYDEIARAISMIDMDETAKQYRRVRPYFESAFAEVASDGERFDGVLRRAIERLTSVELPMGQVALVEKGAIFHYADPKLEALGDAEKHLLRMGPKNARLIQEALARFSTACYQR